MPEVRPAVLYGIFDVVGGFGAMRSFQGGGDPVLAPFPFDFKLSGS